LAPGLGKHYVPAAMHDAQLSGAGCMEGTPTQVLDKVIGLIVASDEPHVVWISGMANSGKTSIALTLCQRLRNDPTVLFGGAFFCSCVANGPARMVVENIVPTLACLLVHTVPECARPLAAELEDAGLVHMTIQAQVEGLLAKPLESLQSFDRPLVFIIDALDQCSGRKQVVELLEAIVQFKVIVSVKFLVTTRPDPQIRKICMLNPSLCSRIELPAHDSKDDIADIQPLLRENSEAWSNSARYNNADLHELAKPADGHMVYTGVAPKYLPQVRSIL